MNCKFFKLIFIYIILLINSFIQCAEVNKVNEVLKKIPLNDRDDLEGLFYQLINNNNFGYTLFGDKPVSFASFFNITPWENFIELGQCDGILWKKWATWEKYRNRFNIQKYLLLKETSNKTSELFIINKK